MAEFIFPEPVWHDEYRVIFGSLAFKLVMRPDASILVTPYLTVARRTSISYTEFKKRRVRAKSNKRAQKPKYIPVRGAGGKYVPRGTEARV
jgi:hypothetical protein